MEEKRRGKPPLKFKTRKELQTALNKYFDETPIEIWTITGLALTMGTTRNLLWDYSKRDDYGEIIKLAKTRVEHSYELGLRTKGDSGSIFGLKNFGWKDKQEIQNTNIDISPLERMTDLYDKD